MSVQENAIGIPIEYSVRDFNGNQKDISGATVKKLLFKKPNGVRMEKPAEFTNPPGTDGLLLVMSADGDLMPYGVFEVQAEFDGRRTAIDTFSVLRNL